MVSRIVFFLILRAIAECFVRLSHTLCLKKNIPDIFDCNFKTNYQILITFGTNIPNITCHQMTV